MQQIKDDGWITRINNALAKKICKQAYRTRKAINNGNSRFVEYNNKYYLNFSSNDYLGLARHPRVITAWQLSAQTEGVGAGGSGHTVGYSVYHQRLEQRLAEWLGYPRALLFNSGFAANQAIVNALLISGDHILADRLSHASLIEAAIQSPAELKRFAHNDMFSLQDLINQPCRGNILVFTEGIFSMDGDLAPLDSLSYIVKTSGGWLMVDDAHGIGVIGEEGRGCTWALKYRPALLIITFGKALGVGGAAVLCDVPVAEYLLQFARNLIYSTAMPPAQAVAIDAALTIVQQGEELRCKLRDNISYFRYGATSIGLNVTPSNTAIQPLIVGNNLHAIKLAQYLYTRGIWITAIRPPTVPPGKARLRITITASHHKQDIDLLLEALSNAQQTV